MQIKNYSLHITILEASNFVLKSIFINDRHYTVIDCHILNNLFQIVDDVKYYILNQVAFLHEEMIVLQDLKSLPIFSSGLHL